jgi:hypothetical protein
MFVGDGTSPSRMILKRLSSESLHVREYFASGLQVFGQFEAHGHAGRASDAVTPSCDAAVSVQVQTCA